MKTLRLAIIGAGKTATWHLKAYSRIPQVRLVGIANPTTNRAQLLARRHGIGHWYRDAEEMLRQGNLDAVDICAPALFHKEYILAALANGLHVYTEKPMCLNSREAQEIVLANRSAGRVIFNGFNYRWWPEMQKIGAIVKSGKLGSIRFARMMRITKDAPEQARQYGHAASLFCEFHSHFVDLLYAFGFPDPETVMASGTTVHDWPTHPDTACVLLTFPGGALAEITTSNASPGLAPEILLVGTEGSLRLDYGRVSILPRRDRWSLPRLIAMTFHEAMTVPYRILRNPFLASCRRFVQGAVSGAPCESDERQALRILRVTDALEESYLVGRPVVIEKHAQ